jgi:tetratricopeptide (TPR) repeat protein
MKSSTEARHGARLVAGFLVAVALMAGCGQSAKKDRREKMSRSKVAIANRLFQMGRAQEALGQANQAIEEWGKNPQAWLVRGQILFAIQEYDRAIADFTTAISHRPGYADALSWRAWARVEKGDFAAAEADWKKALEDTTSLTPEKIYLNLGKLYDRTGREEEALESLQKAVTVNPAYSRGHYELGKAREMRGNTSGAIASYQAALGGMNESSELNLRLAMILEKTGDGARAREHFQRVIELDPDGPEADTARDHLKRLDLAS